MATNPIPRTTERIALLLQAAGVLLVGGALSFRRLGDFDLPWHLAFGRAIVQARTVPRIDDFAYTHRPIQYAEFVSDLLLYGVVQLGGPLALQLLGALCGAATALLLWASTRRYGAVSALVVAAALAAMNPWVLVRPATLSFVLLAVFVLVVETHRHAAEPRGARKLLGALAPLQLLWVNVHGFSVVGVAWLCAYAAYRVAARQAAGRWPRLLPERDGADAGFTAGVALAAVLLSMLNLAGPRLFTGPIRAADDFGAVTEWASPTLEFLSRTEPAVGLFALLLLGALALGREPAHAGRLAPAFDIATILGALALAASAVRLVPVAAILTAPLIARRLSSSVRSTALTRLAGACTITLAAAFMVLRPGTSLGVGFEPFHFPEGAVQYIRAARPVGRMWNFMPFGGYLIWRLHPEHRVLVDGRSAWVHDPALLRRAYDSLRDPVEFESLVSEHHIEFAVTRAAEGESFGAGVAGAERWQMVYWDDASAIYVRRDGPNARLGQEGYRLFRHLMPPGMALEWAMTRPELAEALSHDAALAVAQAPESPRAAFTDACAGIAVRNPQRVRDASERLGRLSPGHPALHVLDAAWRAASAGTAP